MKRATRAATYPLLLVCLFLAGMVLPSLIRNDYLFVIFNVAIFNGIAVTGLNLLYDATGQVSLGHAAFYGLGAYTSALLSVTLGYPLWIAWFCSILVVLVVSFLLAFPTLRLHGHYMVMATLGCNIILSVILNQWESVTGGPSGFPGIPRFSVGSLTLATDRDFFLFAWPVLLAFTAATVTLQKSAKGKIFRALRQNEIATECCGINTVAYKVSAFVLSSLYAGIAGILYAHYMTFISPKTFGVFQSLEWVTMAVVGGMGNVAGGLIGALVLTFLPQLLHALEEWQVLFYGLILMTMLILCPQGLVPAVLTTLFCRGNPHLRSCNPRIEEKPLCLAPVLVAGRKSGRLRLEGLSVSFGGIQALSSVSVAFDPGQIHAVIGPNGAGKTTLFNAICGIVRPDAGKIFLGDMDITGLRPYRIARCGIGRTFQVPQLYPEFSVRDHIGVGLFAGRLPREKIEEVMEFFDLTELSDVPIGRVSLFEKKRIELARAFAASPAYILVDEPGGGLNDEEKKAMGRYLSALQSYGVTPVVIDHHMDLVMKIAERVVVLHQGRVIAEGAPEEIVEDSFVAEAYLGSRHRVLLEAWAERDYGGFIHA